MLEKDEGRKIFLLSNGEEHTLLTLFCAKSRVGQLYHQKDVFIALLSIGCKWDQEVQGGKTALSFLVNSDLNYNHIYWCVRNGANPKKGHLLVYASRILTKSEHEERMEIEKHHIYLTRNGMTPLADPDDYYPPFQNDRLFTYLIGIGAPVDDVEPTTGNTPLIAACSEDNLFKVKMLLEHGASLYRKNKDGMDAWNWATLQDWKFKDNEDDTWDNENPLRNVNLLRHFESEQKQYWTEVVDMSLEQSLLEKVPILDVLQVLSK